jgi:hypothetical protein
MLVALSFIVAIPVMTALYYKVQLDHMEKNPHWMQVHSTYLIDKPR